LERPKFWNAINFGETNFGMAQIMKGDTNFGTDTNFGKHQFRNGTNFGKDTNFGTTNFGMGQILEMA